MPAKIHLTYDDGPDPVWTPRVLDALARHRARATFFLDARRALVQRHLVAEMRGAGHEVGFHCFEHVRHSERDEAEVEADLELGLGLLNLASVRPRAWRAPWGIETETTRRLARERGLRLWGWNVDTHDWRGDDAERMWAAHLAQGGLRDGDVILMHDAIGPGALREGCRETVRLTELLLAAAERTGLRTAGVSAVVEGERPIFSGPSRAADCARTADGARTGDGVWAGDTRWADGARTTDGARTSDGTRKADGAPTVGDARTADRAPTAGSARTMNGGDGA